MRRLTAENLVRAISLLPTNVDFNYASPENPGLIRIVAIVEPEGPIKFISYNPTKGEVPGSRPVRSISSNVIWRMANALSTQNPIHVDQALQGGGNARSVLEALLARTPEFFMCRPIRLVRFASTTTPQQGPKHIWWKADERHEANRIVWLDTDIRISELAVAETVYESIQLRKPPSSPNSVDVIPSLADIGVDRRHAEIQIALLGIGTALGFKSSIAIQDQSIIYKNKRLIEHDGTIQRLNDLPQLSSFPKAASVVRDIDIVWFKNGRLMPAALEIEQSTKVYSGLVRLKRLQDALPDYRVRYVIVASDAERTRVTKAASEPQFSTLNVKYFPYSAVEELYSLSQKRSLKGVTEEFLDCFMEDVAVL